MCLGWPGGLWDRAGHLFSFRLPVAGQAVREPPPPSAPAAEWECGGGGASEPLTVSHGGRGRDREAGWVQVRGCRWGQVPGKRAAGGLLGGLCTGGGSGESWGLLGAGPGKACNRQAPDLRWGGGGQLGWNFSPTGCLSGPCHQGGREDKGQRASECRKPHPMGAGQPRAHTGWGTGWHPPLPPSSPLPISPDLIQPTQGTGSPQAAGTGPPSPPGSRPGAQRGSHREAGSLGASGEGTEPGGRAGLRHLKAAGRAVGNLAPGAETTGQSPSPGPLGLSWPQLHHLCAGVSRSGQASGPGQVWEWQQRVEAARTLGG